MTNRSPEKAGAVAAGCGGEAVPWERLDEALARADIVLSTTGAPEPIVTRERYARIAARRAGGPVGDPRHRRAARLRSGASTTASQTFLFNIDDLKAIREATLAGRRAHFRTAEQIVEQEAQRFTKEWARRRNGPVIEQLTRWCETRRQDAVQHLLSRLRGKLSDADCAATEKAFSRFQNQLLHGPIRPHRGNARRRRQRLHAGGGAAQAVPLAGLKVGAKKGTGPWGKDPINPLGLYDLDRRIRPLGQPYRQLVAEWKHILPTQSQSGSERRWISPHRLGLDAA